MLNLLTHYSDHYGIYKEVGADNSEGEWIISFVRNFFQLCESSWFRIWFIRYYIITAYYAVWAINTCLSIRFYGPIRLSSSLAWSCFVKFLLLNFQLFMESQFKDSISSIFRLILLPLFCSYKWLVAILCSHGELETIIMKNGFGYRRTIKIGLHPLVIYF